MLPRKTSLTIVTLGVLLTLPNYVPALRNYQSLDWRNAPALWEFLPRQNTPSPEADEQARLKPNTDVQHTEAAPVLDADHRLDRFYQALLRAERKEADGVVRIAHYGDSPTTADMITADVRDLLQHQFGDAGHGFVLLTKPWAWYGHRGLEVRSSGWTVTPATQSPHRDGRYGFGGVSAVGGADASAQIDLRDAGHQTVEFAFLRQPDGGSFTVSANGAPLGTVETSGPAEPGFASMRLPAGTRHISLRVVSGSVRLFGAQLLKDGPGVVYHSLGLNGAYVSVLAKFFQADHWAQELQHYRPDLVIINYGTNESMYANFVDFAYQKEMREIVRRLRAALPDVPVLIMSPMDRGQRDAEGGIGTVPALARLVTLQQQVAEETDCAFFNTFEAMGGPGTMGRWYAAEPRLVGADFIHPMPSGAKLIGNLFYRGLLEGYNRYKMRQMRQKLARIDTRS